MFLGKVIGQAESDENSSEENQSRLKVVQKLDLYRNPTGPSSIALDMVGADDGDIVIVGSPSATAETGPLSLSADISPDSMIMGILQGANRRPIRRPPAG